MSRARDMGPDTKEGSSMGESTRQAPCQPRDGVNYRQGANFTNRLSGGFTPFFIADILKPDFSCRAATRCRARDTVGIMSPAMTSTTTTTIHRDIAYSTSDPPPIDLTCKHRRRRDESDSDCSESSSSSSSCSQEKRATSTSAGELMWPAWVYCTRYSDRPSAGPRSRKTRREKTTSDAKRLRTAFSSEQLARLQAAFDSNRYLNEADRRTLATKLALNESQIKIWFQNKRAKLKKSSGRRNDLALKLMAEGLYNHTSAATS